MAFTYKFDHNPVLGQKFLQLPEKPQFKWMKDNIDWEINIHI